MRVLVTGGAGFIGSHLVEHLAGGGHEVRVLDSGSGGNAAPARLPAQVINGDVRDREVVRRALDGVDAVSHHAAVVGMGVALSDLPRYADVNVHGTAVLLAAMAEVGVPKLVLASSMVVYGEGRYDCVHHGPVPPVPRSEADLGAGRFEPRCPHCRQPLAPATVGEDDRLDPRSGYAVTKLAQEHLAATWARETGGGAVALRYHNVYGPRMPRDTPYAGVAAIFCSALSRGEAARVFEDGAQLRDFVHVRDVARAGGLAIIARTAPGPLRAYNIASGQPRTVGDMANELAAAYGGPAPLVTGQFRMGDVRHIVASPRRAEAELGFRAAIPFTEGMRELAGESARAQRP